LFADKIVMNHQVVNIREVEDFSDAQEDSINISIEKVDDILVSSVVPNIIITFQFFARKYFKVEAIVVDLEKKIPFTFAKGINYTGFGADRIIDITEAMQKYPDKNLVIFDFLAVFVLDIFFFVKEFHHSNSRKTILHESRNRRLALLYQL